MYVGRYLVENIDLGTKSVRSVYIIITLFQVNLGFKQCLVSLIHQFYNTVTFIDDSSMNVNNIMNITFSS